MNYDIVKFKDGGFAVTNEHGMYRVHSPKHGKFMWVCSKCKAIAGKSSEHGCGKKEVISPPRGESIPNTIEAWKHHAHLMADLAESNRESIAALKQKINKLEQSRWKAKAKLDRAESLINTLLE